MSDILVVENDKTHRIVIEQIITDLGWNVHSVDNGQSALNEISKNPSQYALVIMDWEMPGLDGLATVRQLRNQQMEYGWPYIPVIAFTGNNSPGDKEKCREAGMDDYLSKEIFQPLVKRYYLTDKITYWLDVATKKKKEQ